MQVICSAHLLKVLLIEDNPADARLVEALLDDEEDIVLHWVTDLHAASVELARTAYDAVLLDLLLPDSGGADLIEAVHEAAPDTAIIVSSGQAAGDCLLARALIRKGVEDFLPKSGLTAALLARTITTAVERRRSTVALRTRAAQIEAALVDARIGHLSWLPGNPDAAIAGALAGLLGLRQATSSLSMRAILRSLPTSIRQSLYAAWREIASGVEHLAIVLVENSHDMAAQGHDLLVELVAQRDAGGHVVRLEALVRDTAMIGHVERLEADMITQLEHTLRTPLTAIRGALGLLAHLDDLPHMVSPESLITTAIANVDRMSGLIGETLERHADDDARLAAEPLAMAKPDDTATRAEMATGRRVSLGPHLHDALMARLPGAAGVGETGATARLSLTPKSRAIDTMVDAARLRRAIDCLFARLAQESGAPERLFLDVELRGGVVWLAVRPLADDVPSAFAAASPGPAARYRPAPAGRGSGPAGLRIAVPMAA